MKKTFWYILSLFTIIALLGLVSSVQAEEETLSIMAPWEGQGRVFQIGPEKLKFLGSFEGIMYIQDAKGTLDAAAFICPAVQEIDAKSEKTTATGNCIITTEKGDLVFSEWEQPRIFRFLPRRAMPWCSATPITSPTGCGSTRK